jgi:diguanylate cyclase (GGDEF)-like protein
MRLSDRAVVEVEVNDDLTHVVRESIKKIASDTWFRTALMLSLAAMTDAWLGLGGAGRLLYLVPVWIVAERFGRAEALASVFGGVLLHAIFGRGIEPAPMGGAILQMLLSAAFVVRFDRHQRKVAKILHNAGHDPLTGVANRATIDAYAERELGKCVKEGRPLTLALIDCDKFKVLNDVYGHARGDEVLRLLSHFVTRSIGSKGKVGRIGGDEFIVVLPGLTSVEAEIRLNRAAEAFGDMTLTRGNKCTISIGLAECPRDTVYLERLIEMADEDMYRRKAERRAGPSLFEMIS